MCARVLNITLGYRIRPSEEPGEQSQGPPQKRTLQLPEKFRGLMKMWMDWVVRKSRPVLDLGVKKKS